MTPRLLPYALIAGLLAGCGVPAQKASDVASIFATAPTLADKVAKLCHTLATRDTTPTTKTLGFSLGDCRDAGTRAINYRSATSLSMTRFNATPVGQNTADVQNIAARGQLWLNRNLLQLLPLLAKLAKMAPTAGSGGDGTGAIRLPSSSSSPFAGLATPTITLTEKPSFDLNNLTFDAKLHVSISGAAKVETDLAIAGGLIDNAVGMTVVSQGHDPPYSTSLLKNLHLAALLVPFADDIYLDLAIDLNLYNLGVPSAIDAAAETMLTTSFKTLLDGVLQP